MQKGYKSSHKTSKQGKRGVWDRTRLASSLPLSIRDNLDTILVPLGRGIVLLDPNLEDGSLALDHVLALQLAGEGVLELGHLELAAGGVLALLGELAVDLASPFACIRHLCLPDLQAAVSVYVLDQEPRCQREVNHCYWFLIVGHQLFQSYVYVTLYHLA